MLFMLIFGHFLADYPLQGQWLAETKSRLHRLGSQNYLWVHSLFAHSFIHAGVVYVITGSIILGILELVAHSLIDFMKCEGYIDLHTDQALHILCKVVWVLILIFVMG